MKLKALFLTLAVIFAANFSANAQDESTYNDEDCKKYRSLYFQYLKQKMYRDACTFWSQAVSNCGDSLDSKFFKNGRIAYERLLKTIDKEDTETIAGINDTIAWIFEERMKIENDADWNADYGVFLMRQKSDDFDKLDNAFKSIHELKDDASYAQIRYYFTHLIMNKFNKAEQDVKEDERANVIEEYIVLSDYNAAAIKKHSAKPDDKRAQKKVESYQKSQDFLDKYFLKIANDCSVLTPVLDKKFETLPEGEEGLKVINKFIGLMEKQKCTDTETYEKYVVEGNNRNPSAAGFAGLGNIYMNKDQTDKAIEAYSKALELEGDGENANAFTLALARAQYAGKKYSSAFRTAKGVTGDLQGDAYVICGNSVAATANGCGESTFMRKANYWLANDYYRRAASAGAEVSSSKFLSSAPSKEEMFAESIQEGASITLSCWGESTTAR